MLEKWNTSDAYRKVTYHQIVKKQLPIQGVKTIYDKKYNSSKLGNFTKTSKAESITKLHNSQIKMKKELQP